MNLRRLWQRARWQFGPHIQLIREDGWVHVRYLLVPPIVSMIWRTFVPRKPKPGEAVVDIRVDEVSGEMFLVVSDGEVGEAPSVSREYGPFSLPPQWVWRS